MRDKRVSYGAALVVAVLASTLPYGTAHAAVSCLGKRATIVGTQGPDRLGGTARRDVIAGLGGADTIRGAGGDDLICGGGKRDLISSGGGHDRIGGGSGGDTIFGNAGKDTIAAGPGSDLALGGGGDDTISLSGGDFNVVDGEAGNDHITAGSPLDIVSYATAPAGVDVDLTAGTATGNGTDLLRGIEAVDGSPFDDSLRGDAGTNFLSGAEGSDTIESGGNEGTLESPDTIFTRQAFDVLSGDLSLFGFGLGEEVGDDAFVGGTGVNVVVYAGARTGVEVDLTTGIATGQGTDSLSNIQMVLGTQFADTLRGDDQPNAFEGEGGRDTIDGGGGQDIAMFVDATRVDADLTTGTSTSIYPGENQAGTATLTGIEDLWGSFGPDTLDGNAFANRMFGLAGGDSMTGSAGDDHLDGGEGISDVTDGGLGTDTCVNGETEVGCEGASGPEVANQEADRRGPQQTGSRPRRYESCNQSHDDRAAEHRGENLQARSLLLRRHRRIGDPTSALGERSAAALAGGEADVVEVSAPSARPIDPLPRDRERLTDALIGAFVRLAGDNSQTAGYRLFEAHRTLIGIDLRSCGSEALGALHAPLSS